MDALATELWNQLQSKRQIEPLWVKLVKLFEISKQLRKVFPQRVTERHDTKAVSDHLSTHATD